MAACPSNAHHSRPKIACQRGVGHAWPTVRSDKRVVQQAHEAAVQAVLGVLPALTQKEASKEAVDAVAYATKYHSEWFWRGREHVKKWRTAH